MKCKRSLSFNVPIFFLECWLSSKPLHLSYDFTSNSSQDPHKEFISFTSINLNGRDSHHYSSFFPPQLSQFLLSKLPPEEMPSFHGSFKDQELSRGHRFPLCLLAELARQGVFLLLPLFHKGCILAIKPTVTWKSQVHLCMSHTCPRWHLTPREERGTCGLKMSFGTAHFRVILWVNSRIKCIFNHIHC